MSEAARIAPALRGHRSGDGWICHCPCPNHGRGRGDRNPSLLVKDGENAILLTCFGGCDREDVLAELRRLGLVDGPPDRRDWRPRPLPAVRPVAEPRHEPDPAALVLWRSAVPIPGTLAESYLRGRGLDVGDVPSLRFLRSARHKSGIHLPAMVAAVQAPDRRIVSVQLTFLDPRGCGKADVQRPRDTVGALGAGAVRLGAAGAVLGLAEGTEDALAAQMLTGVPCWASLGAKRLASIAVPDTVRELHVFADDDQTGRLDADRAARRHVDAGRTVQIRLPKIGSKDWGALVEPTRQEVFA